MVGFAAKQVSTRTPAETVPSMVVKLAARVPRWLPMLKEMY